VGVIYQFGMNCKENIKCIKHKRENRKMKKCPILLVFFILCFVGQAFGISLPYTTDDIDVGTDKFKIKFDEATTVKFTLTIAIVGTWDKDSAYLKYKFPDNEKVEMLIRKNSNEEDTFTLEVDPFSYDIGNKLEISTKGIKDINHNKEKFMVTGVTNTIVTVPEPTTMLLLGAGIIGLAGFGRKKLFKN